MNRRHFLRAAGATAAGAALASPATASHPDRVPDHVTLSFDRGRLENYRPLLVTRHLSDFDPTALYAWQASSPEEETDALVYVAHYRGQRGATRSDSHYLDREPVIVYVDDQDAIDMVAYSAYHWLVGRSRQPPVDESDGGQHPAFRVVQTWHHYVLDEETAGELISVESLGDSESLQADDHTTQYEAWLANGWEDDLRRGALTNPWLMRSQPDFWRDDMGSWSFEAGLRRAYLKAPFDIKGSSKTDL